MEICTKWKGMDTADRRQLLTTEWDHDCITFEYTEMSEFIHKKILRSATTTFYVQIDADGFLLGNKSCNGNRIALSAGIGLSTCVICILKSRFFSLREPSRGDSHLTRGGNVFLSNFSSNFYFALSKRYDIIYINVQIELQCFLLLKAHASCSSKRGRQTLLFPRLWTFAMMGASTGGATGSLRRPVPKEKKRRPVVVKEKT
jgi:hypothetical protein